jgi:capsular exopolysaccharide synthesis family protein
MSKEFSRDYPNLKTNGFSYRKYLILLLSKWYWLLLTLVISAGAAYLFNDTVPKRYRIESLIYFDEEARPYRTGSTSDIENLNMLNDINRFELESDIELLQSYQMVRKTLEKLDFDISYFSEGLLFDHELYKEAPFEVMADPSPALNQFPVFIDPINTEKYKLTIDRPELFVEYVLRYGEQFNKHGLNLILLRNEDFAGPADNQERFYFIGHSLDNLTKTYQNKLTVEPIEEGSNMILIASSGELKEKEQEFLNALIDTYSDHQLERINRNADLSIDFINQQLGVLDNRLLAYENELQQLWMSNSQIRNNYLYPNHLAYGNRQDQSSPSSSYDQLSTLENQKAQMERNREDFVYLANQIKNNRNIDSIALPMSEEIAAAGITQLMQELASTQHQISATNMNIQSDHPFYQSLNQTYTQQKQSALTKVNSYIAYIDQSIGKLTGQIAQIEREIPSYPIVERRYREALRKISQNENVIEILSEKKIEFELVKASGKPNFELLKAPGQEHAQLIYPNARLNYLVAFFLGLVLPATVIIMKKNNYSRIEEKEEIKNNTSIPILHAIEHNPFKTSLPVYHYPQSPIADGFRTIRTKLMFHLKPYDPKVITISSMVSGEGKSFIASNLVAILAMGGMNTVIVSADIRKPTLHKIFSINSKLGLSDYLSNNFNYEDLIQPTLVDNLYILPPGKATFNAGDLFSENKISTLLDYLSSRFEFIVFDSPPYSLVPEAMIIGEQSHCNIFIVRHDYSPKNIIGSLNDIQKEGRLQNIFLVVNSVKKMRGFGFEHYFGYDSSYGFGHYSHYYNNKKRTKKIPEHVKVK